MRSDPFLSCTFPVPSLYLPCTFCRYSVAPCGVTPSSPDDYIINWAANSIKDRRRVSISAGPHLEQRRPSAAASWAEEQRRIETTRERSRPLDFETVAAAEAAAAEGVEEDQVVAERRLAAIEAVRAEIRSPR